MSINAAPSTKRADPEQHEEPLAGSRLAAGVRWDIWRAVVGLAYLAAATFTQRVLAVCRYEWTMWERVTLAARRLPQEQ
jgi:hypothetical protein